MRRDNRATKSEHAESTYQYTFSLKLSVRFVLVALAQDPIDKGRSWHSKAPSITDGIAKGGRRYGVFGYLVTRKYSHSSAW